MCEESLSAAESGERGRYAIRAGRQRSAFAADYLSPELAVTACVVESGFAATGTENEPMVEDPWEDL